MFRVTFVLALASAACSRPSASADPAVVPVEATSAEATAQPPPAPPPKPAPSKESLAETLRKAFADANGGTLANMASAQGVRFSPYAYVTVATDVELSRAELSTAFENDDVRHWGSFDGSGDPIELTFSDYVERFVVPEAFEDSDIVVHTIEEPGRVGRGNTIDNIAEAYPQAAFWLELHNPGRDPQYEGMDWVSLRLVFVVEQGTPKLRGVIHDQWTI